MLELMELILLSPGARIVVLYPGKRERFFELNVGCPVGHGTCWVSIGDKSRINLKDLGIVDGLARVLFVAVFPLVMREPVSVFEGGTFLGDMGVCTLAGTGLEFAKWLLLRFVKYTVVPIVVFTHAHFNRRS